MDISGNLWLWVSRGKTCAKVSQLLVNILLLVLCAPFWYMASGRADGTRCLQQNRAHERRAFLCAWLLLILEAGLSGHGGCHYAQGN